MRRARADHRSKTDPLARSPSPSLRRTPGDQDVRQLGVASSDPMHASGPPNCQCQLPRITGRSQRVSDLRVAAGLSDRAGDWASERDGTSVRRYSASGFACRSIRRCLFSTTSQMLTVTIRSTPGYAIKTVRRSADSSLTLRYPGQVRRRAGAGNVHFAGDRIPARGASTSIRR